MATAGRPWADLDDHKLMTERIHAMLDRFLALSVVCSVAVIVGFSFLEHPWWPLGLAVGLGYGGVVFVQFLFMHVACKHAMRRHVVGEEELKRTAWRIKAAAAVVIVVFLAGSCAFDALDRKAVVVGVMCAIDVLAVSGILIWWCYVARGGDDGDAAAAGRFKCTSPEINSV